MHDPAYREAMSTFAREHASQDARILRGLFSPIVPIGKKAESGIVRMSSIGGDGDC